MRAEKNQYIFQAIREGPEPGSSFWDAATSAETDRPDKETAPAEQGE